MRVGVTGCGRVATEMHLPALRQIKGVEVVAICDKDENKAKETARHFGSISYCTNFSDMLEKRLDVVHICTPPQTHGPLSIQALNAHCHVLVEKPLALSINEANAVIEACERNKVKLCVAHNSLFNPVVVRARSLVESGALGDVLHVDIKYSTRRDDRLSVKESWTHHLPGGIFGEIAPHPVYLQHALIGNIKHVHTVAKKFSSSDWTRADELRVLLEAESATGSISISCNSPRDRATLDIFGTNMTLHLDLWTLTTVKYRPAKFGPVSSALGNLAAGYQLWRDTLFTSLKYPLGKVHSGHFTLIPKFIESIQNNTEPPVTAEAGRETVRILEIIWQQIEQDVSK